MGHYIVFHFTLRRSPSLRLGEFVALIGKGDLSYLCDRRRTRINLFADRIMIVVVVSFINKCTKVEDRTSIPKKGIKEILI